MFIEHTHTDTQRNVEQFLRAKVKICASHLREVDFIFRLAGLSVIQFIGLYVSVS